MIQYLDETLRILLSDNVPMMRPASIQFERPTQAWEDQTTDPRINCFLYDIRENLQLRYDRRPYVSRNEATGTGTQRLVPRRMDFTYLITAWCAEVADEHELLGNILKTLLRYPILPPEMLHENLSDQPLPVRTWVAQPEDTPSNWEFWGANEWRLKAGISYRITLSIEPEPVTVGLVRETETRVRFREDALAEEAAKDTASSPSSPETGT
jgi:hypothetical protein